MNIPVFRSVPCVTVCLECSPQGWAARCYPQKGVRHVAIYHCSIKVISCSKGKSAVAAAYRAGEKIKNKFDGETHDYTRKGGVVHTEILLSDHAPAEYADSAVLWNKVEKIEKAKNAQLAPEIEIALPRQLTRKQGISLAREYVKRHFVAAGMCADVCLHDTGGGNPHAHIMLTMCSFDEGGMGTTLQPVFGAERTHGMRRPPQLRTAGNRPDTHRPFRRCRFRYGKAQHTHRARRPQPRNRGNE